jgi:hypothetical protein
MACCCCLLALPSRARHARKPLPPLLAPHPPPPLPASLLHAARAHRSGVDHLDCVQGVVAGVKAQLDLPKAAAPQRVHNNVLQPHTEGDVRPRCLRRECRDSQALPTLRAWLRNVVPSSTPTRSLYVVFTLAGDARGRRPGAPSPRPPGCAMPARMPWLVPKLLLLWVSSFSDEA